MFAMHAVILHIADIIQIQHPNTRKTDRDTAPNDFPCHRLRLQIITAYCAQQAEEEEYAQVTQTDIAVTVFA
jgi:hypothetical protein